LIKAWIVAVIVFSANTDDTDLLPLDMMYPTIEECEENAERFLQFMGPDMLKKFSATKYVATTCQPVYLMERDNG